MVRHLLRDFEPPAVLQVGGDPRCPEGKAADFCLDAGRSGPAANHAVGVLLVECAVGERLNAASRARLHEISQESNDPVAVAHQA